MRIACESFFAALNALHGSSEHCDDCSDAAAVFGTVQRQQYARGKYARMTGGEMIGTAIKFENGSILDRVRRHSLVSLRLAAC
ncbi:hypothetical protein [Bradyrhizobium sp. DASA03007]|uniref:hypothetical protein n=1 Tax=unclassified Bradyrhizobium TaxID=2631580 RepID=UPI003F704710